MPQGLTSKSAQVGHKDPVPPRYPLATFLTWTSAAICERCGPRKWFYTEWAAHVPSLGPKHPGWLCDLDKSCHSQSPSFPKWNQRQVINLVRLLWK